MLAAGSGYDRLTPAFGRYLSVSGAFTVAVVLSNSYFNIFLLRAIGSSMAMMRYNLLLALVQPLVMLCAVRVLRRVSVGFCMRVGLALHAAAYVWLACTNEATESVVYLLSVLFASGNAFYYTSYTPQLLAYTTDETRDTAYGAMGLLSTVATLTLPLMAGFFISAFGNLNGYRALFGISAAALCLGFALSFRLTPVAAGQDKRTRFLATARRIVQNKSMLAAMTATLLNAIRASGTAYYGSLVMYQLLRKESIMGVISTASAICGLLITLVYGRMMRPARRGLMMLLGVGTILVGISVLCLTGTVGGYIVYALLSAAAGVFIDNPVVTAYMGVLQNDEILCENGAEAHTLREFFYASGRALGLLPVFFIADIGRFAAPMLLLITAMQIPSALLTNWLQKRAKK